MAFVFGGNTGLSYEEMLRQRDLATQLAGNVSQGGYTALGSGLASGLLARRADKAQKEGGARARENAANAAQGALGQSVLGQLFGQQVMGGQPMRSGGAAPLDPMSPTAIAGDTMAALGKDGGTAGYRASLIGTESGGNWGAQNNEVGAGGQAGHYGRVQFGKARLQEAMNAGAIPQGTTPEQFMASPALQVAAENWHFGDLENQLGDLVGTVVNGKPMDMGALVAMGHLGGAGGARRYVESGGQYNPSDSFGTSLAEYADTHGGQTTMSAQNAPTAGGMDPAALVSAMSDPYLDEGTRSVLGQLFQAQIQKSDPSYQMGMQADRLNLERAQLELDQARTPKPGFRTLSAQEAQQVGLPEGGVYQVGPDGQIEVVQQPPGADVSGIPEYGLSPVWGVNDKGEPVLMQIGKDGTAVQTKIPDGVTPDPAFKAFETAKGSAEGKAAGEDAALLESVSSKMPGLEQVVSELDALAETATYTIAGQVRDALARQVGADPGESAIARTEYIAKVNNQILPMLKDTFGAAFTVKEGDTLRETLGDPDKSPQEKQAVLRAFIEQKRRDVESLSNRVGGDAAPKKEAGTGTTLTYNPQTGDFE